MQSCPPYSESRWQAVAAQPPPPDPPELPEGAAPRWPPWYAGVGFLVALTADAVAVGIVAAVLGVNTDDEDATFTALATVAQSADLHRHGRHVRVVHAQADGLALRAAAGAASGPRSAGRRSGCSSSTSSRRSTPPIVQPDAEQTVAQDLGADEGTFGLIAAGFLIICVAPVAEEFFFRGFFFKALRSRYSVLAAGGASTACCSG